MTNDIPSKLHDSNNTRRALTMRLSSSLGYAGADDDIDDDDVDEGGDDGDANRIISSTIMGHNVNAPSIVNTSCSSLQ